MKQARKDAKSRSPVTSTSLQTLADASSRQAEELHQPRSPDQHRVAIQSTFESKVFVWYECVSQPVQSVNIRARVCGVGKDFAPDGRHNKAVTYEPK